MRYRLICNIVYDIAYMLYRIRYCIICDIAYMRYCMSCPYKSVAILHPIFMEMAYHMASCSDIRPFHAQHSTHAAGTVPWLLSQCHTTRVYSHCHRAQSLAPARGRSSRAAPGSGRSRRALGRAAVTRCSISVSSSGSISGSRVHY